MAADWFRSWHGAPTDPKWRVIAKRAKVAPSLVVAVAWALMDRASQSEVRGSIEGLDAETLADFMGCDAEQIDAIVSALRHKGVLSDDTFKAWERRQPQREDGSAERGKAWREQKKLEAQIEERDAEIAALKANAAERASAYPNEERPQNEPTERDRTQTNANEHREEEKRLDNYAATRARERERLDQIERDLLEAAGLQNSPAPSLSDLSPILGLIDAGFDFAEDILPIVRARRRKGVMSWGYFVGAIQDARAARAAAGAPRQNARDGPSPSRATRGAASALAGIESFHRRAEVE